jgi:hypothetical protein
LDFILATLYDILNFIYVKFLALLHFKLASLDPSSVVEIKRLLRKAFLLQLLLNRFGLLDYCCLVLIQTEAKDNNNFLKTKQKQLDLKKYDTM